MRQRVICVIDDSITNSVFFSQLIVPMQKKFTHITIISFERHPQCPRTKKILTRLKKTGIDYIILKKYVFLGAMIAYITARRLQALLRKLPADKYIARGPIAGYYLLNNVDMQRIPDCTVQIRGILHQEYLFAHNRTNVLRNFFHTLRARMYWNLERQVYTHPQVLFECVSQALRTYIIDQFGSNPVQCTIANHDIPDPISPHQKNAWRTCIRQQLTIPSDTQVYCYNGSIKPWQCPERMLTYFTQISHANKHLLILSVNVQEFNYLIEKMRIPKHNISLLCVPNEKIYQYLATADFGIIFRHPHIINWTSRPTKILEYQAAGLEIIHNNTIAYLQDKRNDHCRQQVSQSTAQDSI